MTAMSQMKLPKMRTPIPNKDARALTPRARKRLYEQFQAHTDEVREVLLEILRNPEADDGDRIRAGKEILNRGWGQSPSVSIVDATLKVQDQISPEALNQMSPRELQVLESALAKLIHVPDAEVLEIGNESAEHAPMKVANESQNDALQATPAETSNESANDASAETRNESANDAFRTPRRRQRRA